MTAQIDWSGNDARRDEGFIEAVTPDVARRQFRLSLGLMAVIATAVVALAASSGLSIAPAHAPDHASTLAATSVQQPQFVRPVTAGGRDAAAGVRTGVRM